MEAIARGHGDPAVIWNEVARAFPELGLCPLSVPSFRPPPRRIDWSLLADSFTKDFEDYLAWCASTDPFAADARSRPQQNHLSANVGR